MKLKLELKGVSSIDDGNAKDIFGLAHCKQGILGGEQSSLSPMNNRRNDNLCLVQGVPLITQDSLV